MQDGKGAINGKCNRKGLCSSFCVTLCISRYTSDIFPFIDTQNTAKPIIVGSDPHRYRRPATAGPCLIKGVCFKWILLCRKDASKTAVKVLLSPTEREGRKKLNISALNHSSLYETCCSIRRKITKTPLGPMIAGVLLTARLLSCIWCAKMERVEGFVKGNYLRTIVCSVVSCFNFPPLEVITWQVQQKCRFDS